jgi:transcriptional regulator with XRE-family HTH domain
MRKSEKALTIDPQKMRRLRLNANLTQIQLGEKAGVSTDTITRWETAKAKRPHPSALNKVARVFGIQATELLED